MEKFTNRYLPPSYNSPYWIHKSKGGLNECIIIKGNSVLPNCVGYSWGRFYELTGKKPKLSKGNAEDWYAHNDGYTRSQNPKLGAVACWKKGKVCNSNDGCGHVAIVEKINDDGSIIISESGYSSFRFRCRTLSSGYKLEGYDFQGFIYPPCYKDNGEEIVNIELKVLKKGLINEQVKTIQRILYCLFGCPEDLKIDGVFGTRTEYYVKLFQKNNSITVDGIIGNDTWCCLLK